MPMGDDPNRRGGSRRWIAKAVEDSLRRLGTNWIDLYQEHRPSPDIDIEETLGALTDLVQQGKVRHVGSSSYSGSQIVEAQWTARERGLQRFRTEQRDPASEALRALRVIGDQGFRAVAIARSESFRRTRLPERRRRRLDGVDVVEPTDTYLLRPGEVVERLGVSRSWLYEAAKSGRIPCVRLGGSDGPVRFEPREIEAGIERSRAIVLSGEEDVRAGRHSELVPLGRLWSVPVG